MGNAGLSRLNLILYFQILPNGHFIAGRPIGEENAMIRAKSFKPP
jgi:hypothetical protein